MRFDGCLDRRAVWHHLVCLNIGVDEHLLLPFGVVLYVSASATHVCSPECRSCAANLRRMWHARYVSGAAIVPLRDLPHAITTMTGECDREDGGSLTHGLGRRSVLTAAAMVGMGVAAAGSGSGLPVEASGPMARSKSHSQPACPRGANYGRPDI